ncbi:MAG: ATPase domain-containing protein [Thermoplasmata archaeon]
MDRIKTGIPGLDEILGGGFTKRSVNLISGRAGTGKTIFALDYIFNGARLGEKGLFITFEETIENLFYHVGQNRAKEMRKHMDRIFVTDVASLRLKESEGKELISPNLLRDTIKSIVPHYGVTRVAIDSISAISSMVLPQDFRNLFFSLANLLKELNVTSVITTEIPDGKEVSRCEIEEFIADSIIRLSRHECERTITIEKMRGTNITPLPQLMYISSTGISVFPDNTHPRKKVKTKDKITTGIKEFDNLLGGLERGAVMLFCIDSDSYDSSLYVPFTIAAMQEAAARGEAIVNMPFTEMTPLGSEYFLQKFEQKVAKLIDKNRILIADWIKRDLNKIFAKSIKIYPQSENSVTLLEHDLHFTQFFLAADILGLSEILDWNTIKKIFSILEKRTKKTGSVAMFSLNPSLVEPTFLEYMKTVSTHIIYIYRKGKYNYLEVTKNKSGSLSNPTLIYPIDEKPYITLKST